MRHCASDLGNRWRNWGAVEWSEVVELIVFRHSPVLAVLLELMKMAVGPAHDDLEGAVEAAQFDGTGNLDAPPDGRVNIDQRDLELVDGRRCLRRHGRCFSWGARYAALAFFFAAQYAFILLPCCLR